MITWKKTRVMVVKTGKEMMLTLSGSPPYPLAIQC
jgi:hypothetical protein